ncbi:MAG: hypothetical protein R3D57_15210 [Hyphomicrobiaceae bacterium]
MAKTLSDMDGLSDEQLDQLLMAYVDGEAEAGQVELIERALKANPELAGRLDVYRITGRSLAPHFDEVLQAQPPARMLQTIRSVEIRPVVKSASLSIGDTVGRLLSSIGLGAAPRAALAGVAIGMTIAALVVQWSNSSPQSDDGALIANRGHAMFAAGQLSATLEDATMAASAGTPVKIVNTFQEHSGRYCRTYWAETQYGLACRDGAKVWRVIALLETGIENEGYGPSGGDTSGVDTTAANMMASSAPLDPEAEERLVKSGWASP